MKENMDDNSMSRYMDNNDEEGWEGRGKKGRWKREEERVRGKAHLRAK